MTDVEAEMAVKARASVGTSNVATKGGFCSFSTGRLIKRVKVKGSKLKQYLFKDRWREAEVIRPASAFMLIR